MVDISLAGTVFSLARNISPYHTPTCVIISI